MSDDPTPSVDAGDTRRDELRMKIEAGERRIAERDAADQIKEAAQAAANYTRENPLTVIGGAVVAGVLIGLMTSPGRRVASRAATGAATAIGTAATRSRRAAEDLGDEAAHVARETKAEASRISNFMQDAIVAFGIKLIDDFTSAAQSGQDAIEDIGESAGAKARRLRREARHFAANVADSSLTTGRRTRRRAERAVRDLTGRNRG